jgi:hypothetical protein
MKDLLTPDQLTELQMGGTTERLNDGRKPMGFLDSVMFALTGTPDQLLTPEDMKARAGRRKDATQMSAAAAENPGEQFMGIPSAGGSGAGIDDLIKLGVKLFS